MQGPVLTRNTFSFYVVVVVVVVVVFLGLLGRQSGIWPFRFFVFFKVVWVPYQEIERCVLYNVKRENWSMNTRAQPTRRATARALSGAPPLGAVFFFLPAPARSRPIALGSCWVC